MDPKGLFSTPWTPEATATGDLKRLCAHCGRRNVVLVGATAVTPYGRRDASEAVEFQALRQFGAQADATRNMHLAASVVACPSCGRMPREGIRALGITFLTAAPAGAVVGGLVAYVLAEPADEVWLSLLFGGLAALATGAVAAAVWLRNARTGALAERVD
jgi:hypothetical protein